MYYLICPVGVIGGKEDLLTYTSALNLSVGTVVSIPFGQKFKIGIVWAEATKPGFAVKEVSEVYDEVVPGSLLRLADWIQKYYATRLSLIMQTILPSGLGKNRRDDFSQKPLSVREDKHLPNPDQRRAIDYISKSGKTTHLLHGVTGSGKTLVYRELTRKMLDASKSSIILVPEISLTPQLASHFESLTKNVIILHSRLTEAMRHQAWRKINNSVEPMIIIGPRSALFAPVNNLGLVIVDECHEPSYIQDSQPKYSALRVARALADLHPKSKLVLGSATPNITDYYLAKNTDTPIIELSKTTEKYDRDIHIIDARVSDGFTKSRLLSNKLLQSLEDSLKNGDQSLLFHNRRATARLALCSSCGWSAECSNCHIPMRLHHDTHKLKCHVCALTTNIPTNCPSCKQPDIEFKGFGSKRIEQEVKKLFPNAKVARFDSDTPEKEQLHNRYDELMNGKIDIIIGTQGIAKGLDLPRLSTIGAVSSDTEMYVPDFSSAERTFQLISQVLGRAGRSGQKSHVYIQSLNPENFVIQTASKQDYDSFYKNEIENRQSGHLPPFTFLLQLQIGYKTIETAEKHCRDLKISLKKSYPKVTIYEPTSAFHAYRAGKHFMQLVLTSQTRSTLVHIANSLPQNWQFTLDPINLM